MAKRTISGRAVCRVAFAAVLVSTSMLAFAVDAVTVGSAAKHAPDPLQTTIAALDTAVFDAFNRCAAADQLRKHAEFFAPDVEFYHDTGGVTWTRAAMIDNTQNYVCGKFRREIVAGSLNVYPVKDFGAIEQGLHRFCQFDSGKCDGMVDFVIVWRQQGTTWQITCVLSYGHREIAAPPDR